MKFTSSRILNKRPGFLGLDIWDLSGLGYLLILSFRAFEQVGFGPAAIVVTGVAGIALIRIRVSGRQKIIRDYAKHLVRKAL